MPCSPLQGQWGHADIVHQSNAEGGYSVMLSPTDVAMDSDKMFEVSVHISFQAAPSGLYTIACGCKRNVGALMP